MSRELQPGSVFKIGRDHFEYEGTTPVGNNPGEFQVVGRINPDIPTDQGTTHKLFTVEQIQREATIVPPFNELFPFSTYVNEVKTWRGLLGPEIRVPHPPQELVDVQGRLKEIGLNSFKPHFLPPVEFHEEEIKFERKRLPYPTNWASAGNFFFNHADDPIAEMGKIPGGVKLKSGWVLIDTTPKIGEYPNDPLIPFIDPVAQLTTRRQLVELHGIDQINHIFNLMSTEMELSKSSVVRFPRALEINALGNLFYPEWKQGGLGEIIEDVIVLSSGDVQYLSTASGDNGRGLNISEMRGRTGFRPIIVFNGK